MKIKIKELNPSKLNDIKPYSHIVPKRQSSLLSFLVRLLAEKDLKETNFKYKEIRMDLLKKDEPCLILMNHSAFIDLMIAFTILKGRKFNIITTDDGFIGKKILMRLLGCTPTKKFVSDYRLITDMKYIFNNLKQSVLMFPEAGYSLDGSNSLLPDSLGRLVKNMKVPVVSIITHGAYLRDPLYNNLQLRKVNVSADVELLLTKEEVDNTSSEDILKMINDKFTFNAYKEQKDNGVLIKEPFRADYLHRILYKCPHCEKEDSMVGEGTHIGCLNCKAEYYFNEDGSLINKNGPTIFDNITDWVNYQKDSVKKEIEDGTYKLDVNVDIYAIKDLKALYHLGKGKLIHNLDGFDLISNDRKIIYYQSPLSSYSLNSDFYWYEIGDMISIGDLDTRYYCILDIHDNVAFKTRLAAQYIFDINKNKLR